MCVPLSTQWTPGGNALSRWGQIERGETARREEGSPHSILSSPSAASAALWPLLCVRGGLARGQRAGLWAAGFWAREGQGEAGTLLLESPFWETGVIWKGKRGWEEACTPRGLGVTLHGSARHPSYQQ